MTVALWAERWPAIAKQECIDKVAAVPVEEQPTVKWQLPCLDCELNTACLNAKRKELGPLLYDREILTRPRTSESSLFPMELFEPLLRRGEQLVPFWHKPFGVEHEYGVASAWDLAWSERIGGDWLVKMTAMINRRTGVRTVLDIGRWQRLTFDEQIDLITAEWRMFEDDVVVIEADVAQKVWSQHLSDKSAVPVMAHYAAGKSDLATGVPGLLLQLEQKRWEFPYTQGTRNFENMKAFLGECEAFGWVDGKLQGVGEHDDCVMAWFHLAWALERLATPQHRREYSKPVVPGARM